MIEQKSLPPETFARRTLFNFEVQDKLRYQVESNGYLPELSDSGSQPNHRNLQQHSAVADRQICSSLLTAVSAVSWLSRSPNTRKGPGSQTRQRHLFRFLVSCERKLLDFSWLLNTIRTAILKACYHCSDITLKCFL